MAVFTTEWLVRHHITSSALRTLNHLEKLGMSERPVRIDPERVRAELGYESRYAVDRHIRELQAVGVLEKIAARTYKETRKEFI